MGFEAHTDLFIEESLDLLNQIENPLMQLEENPKQSGLVDDIFRVMHTIKGSAGMFGLNDIAQFTHDLETTFDSIRKGEIEATPEIIELTLQAKDCIREMLLKNNSDVEQETREMIISRLRELVNIKTDAARPEQTADANNNFAAGEACRYSVRFAPNRDIFMRGVNIPLLLKELMSLGEGTLSADIGNVPLLDAFDPESCYLSWKAELVTDKSEADIRSVFIFVEDYARIEIINNGSAGINYTSTAADSSGAVRRKIRKKSRCLTAGKLMQPLSALKTRNLTFWLILSESLSLCMRVFIRNQTRLRLLNFY
jgi:two-component system, chemotaxis family, sensor kinase CheA